MEADVLRHARPVEAHGSPLQQPHFLVLDAAGGIARYTRRRQGRTCQNCTNGERVTQANTATTFRPRRRAWRGHRAITHVLFSLLFRRL